jgi:hypothetical protein
LQPWTPDSFAALRHAVIAPTAEDGFGKVHDSLAMLHLPDWTSPGEVESAQVRS